MQISIEPPYYEHRIVTRSYLLISFIFRYLKSISYLKESYIKEA